MRPPHLARFRWPPRAGCQLGPAPQ